MRQRKGMTALQVVVTAIILIVVAVVVIFIFRDLIGRQAGVVGEQISSLGDCDCDGIRNFMDKCPCEPFVPGEEHPTLGGCPDGSGVTKPIPCSEDLKKRCNKYTHIGKQFSALCPEISGT